MRTFIAWLHAAFILFSLFGGFLLFTYPSLAWVHLPCVLWSVFVEIANFPCPLTQLEDRLHNKEAPMQVDFMTHYCVGYFLPNGFTVLHHKIIGVIILVAQANIYYNVFPSLFA